jgi:hypothetical protein
VDDLAAWNELSRREQRILIKLFGGGSVSGESQEETVNLRRLGLITDAGLSAAGLKLFISAFNAQRDARRSASFA